MHGQKKVKLGFKVLTTEVKCCTTQECCLTCAAKCGPDMCADSAMKYLIFIKKTVSRQIDSIWDSKSLHLTNKATLTQSMLLLYFPYLSYQHEHSFDINRQWPLWQATFQGYWRYIFIFPTAWFTAFRGINNDLSAAMLHSTEWDGKMNIHSLII